MYTQADRLRHSTSQTGRPDSAKVRSWLVKSLGKIYVKVILESDLISNFGASIDAKKNQVEMSLKKNDKAAKGKKTASTGLADYAVDQKVDTIVKKVCSPVSGTG